MAQARSLHSAAQTRDPHRQRSRNLRMGLVLIATFLALFLGSILYILLQPTVK